MSHLFLFAIDTRRSSNALVPNWYGRYRPERGFRNFR